MEMTDKKPKNIDDRPPIHKARKNRRRWCKGKVGVEHQYGEYEKLFPDLKISKMYQRICEGCGRKDLKWGAGMKLNRINIQIGAVVTFDSGNFAGLTGEITNVDWNSKEPGAIYGYYHTVKLSDGRVGYIEKGEHIGSISDPEKGNK